MKNVNRTTLALLAAAALATAPVLGLTPAAQAHNYLASSNPTADSVITEVPEVFSVTTNSALLDLSGTGNGFAIQVTDAAGLYYGDGCAVVDAATLSSGATLGAAGAYTLIWQLISEDGHTVSGEFGFTFEPSADAVISAGSPTPPVCGVPTVPEATEEPTASPEPTAVLDEPVTAQPEPTEATSALPWIIGSGAVVAAGAVIAVVLLRRRGKADETDTPAQQYETDTPAQQ